MNHLENILQTLVDRRKEFGAESIEAYIQTDTEKKLLVGKFDSKTMPVLEMSFPEYTETLGPDIEFSVKIEKIEEKDGN